MAAAIARPGHPIRNGRSLALLALAALVLSGIVVALVRGPGSSADDDSGASIEALSGATTTMARTGEYDAADEQAKGSGAAATTGGGSSASPGVARAVVPPLERVVRTADMRLVVKGDVADAADRAAVIASSLGGFVANSSTSTGRRAGSASLTMRVPVDRFDEARSRLARLGRVEGTDMSGEDVGGQLVDLDARLRSLRAEETALDALLAKAGDIGQILQVRDRLTGVRTEIEQLAGQQAALEDRAALATIHVSMRTSGAPAPEEKDDGSSGLGESFRTAVNAAEAVAGGMAIVVGALLPFLVLGLVAWPIVARVRRRSVSPPQGRSV